MPFLHGINLTRELLAHAPQRVQRVFLVSGSRRERLAELRELANDAGVRVEERRADKLSALVDGNVHQGVVAEVAGFCYTDLDDALALGDAPALWLVLDEIQDPQNLGSLLRSSWAFGVRAVMIPERRSAPVTPTVERVAAGGTVHVPVVRVTNLARGVDQLRDAGLWTVAALPRATAPLASFDLTEPVALVVGSEERGVRPGVQKVCDAGLTIPMPGGAESLNAAVSGAVMLYEVIRQRSSANSGRQIST